MKKIFVVSDIHGHCTLLQKALERAGFDDANEDHLLICCGDYFDRGTENVEMLQFLERVPRKILVRGNHEDQLLKLFRTGKVLPHHYLNGTFCTLENFFGKYCIDPLDDTIDFSGKTRVVDRLCEFMEETVDYCETEHYLFVHGWIPEGVTAYQTASKEAWKEARRLKWIHKYTGQRPMEGKTLVCGHVPTRNAANFDPKRAGTDHSAFHGNGIVVLDAGVLDSKQINVLVLEGENIIFPNAIP